MTDADTLRALEEQLYALAAGPAGAFNISSVLVAVRAALSAQVAAKPDGTLPAAPPAEDVRRAALEALDLNTTSNMREELRRWMQTVEPAEERHRDYVCGILCDAEQLEEAIRALIDQPTPDAREQKARHDLANDIEEMARQGVPAYAAGNFLAGENGLRIIAALRSPTPDAGEARAVQVRPSLEDVARAICVKGGWDPDGNDDDCRPDNESPDGWLNWFYFNPEACAVDALYPAATVETGGCETFDTIAEWCEQTFGPISPKRIAERAFEEMGELLEEPDKVEEAADVVIVLSRYPGLWEAVQRKMAINRQRKWRLMADGTGYHVKPAPPATAPQGQEGVRPNQSKGEDGL